MPDVKRPPRLDPSTVTTIRWLADLLASRGLSGTVAANAKLALAAACQRAAKTEARREALLAAVAEPDTDRAKARLAVLREAFSEAAALAQRRFVIPHPKVAPTPRARGVGGRYIKAKPSGR